MWMKKEIAAQNIRINDIIKVLPGEIIPGDGVIIKRWIFNKPSSINWRVTSCG